jgi:hypothetical protein
MAEGLSEREQALINRELGVCQARRAIEEADAEDKSVVLQ